MPFFKRILRPQASCVKPELPQDDKNRAIDILARTLWGEARGESLIGIEAVASVILNRVAKAKKKGGFWWGNTIEQVCLKPYQFSCWNKNDPNYPKLQAMDVSDQAFAVCLRIARRAVHGVLKDRTGGATHYHTKDIQPKWALSAETIADIGHHVFYKLDA